MDFSLSEEQRMLADSVARFIDTEYDFETRQRIAAAGPAGSRWSEFAELGWTALPFAEADGGLGGGAVELMLVMEQFGRGLVVEPFVANVVLAGGILKRTAGEDRRQDWLQRIVAGELQCAVAVAEPQGRFDPGNVTSTATPREDGYVLNGRKSVVLNGGDAELLIVPARTSGTGSDTAGITLFAVDAGANGLCRRPYPTVDGQRAADLEFDDVTVGRGAVLGEPGGGFEPLSEAVDDAVFAVAAEGVGIMQAMFDKTLDYVRERRQFGVPIGSFQALQHRLVDCLVACEQTRSLMYRAAMLKDGGGDAAAATSALKYQLGTAGVALAREAVQLHGGMGVSWEMDIAHYFKRLTAIDILFGNADYHLDRYIDLSRSA